MTTLTKDTTFLNFGTFRSRNISLHVYCIAGSANLTLCQSNFNTEDRYADISTRALDSATTKNLVFNVGNVSTSYIGFKIANATNIFIAELEVAWRD